MMSINLSIEDLQKHYLKKTFLTSLYNYYVYNGYYNIITRQLVYIFTNTFILVYFLFLIKCVNWHILINLENKTNAKEVIDMSNIYKLNYYNIIIVSIFFIYFICKIINVINDTIKYKEVKIFYNKILDIDDYKLPTLKWEDIILKFKKIYNNEDINVLYINNKITLKDNYIITLFDKNIIKIDYLTELMEWNIMYCFINPIFNKNFNYKQNFLFIDNEFLKTVEDRVKTVAIVNFILMPFILPFLILKNLFHYGEQFYNNPELLSSRHWTRNAKWIFRNYNELFHEFHEKMLNSTKIAKEYSNQFSNKIIETFCKLLLFIFSSFFIMLIIISIANENTLINMYIGEKNIIWYLGVFGTIIALLRTIIKDRIIYYPDDKLVELKKVINNIDEINIKDKKHKEYFFKLYQYHISTLIKDIIHTLMVPFKLYKLSFESNTIIHYLSEITINNSNMGHTNKYALIHRDNDDLKTGLSKETFFKNNKKYSDLYYK